VLKAKYGEDKKETNANLIRGKKETCPASEPTSFDV
jgi:hypothetical protein